MISLALIHAAYFVLTGAWPLVHMRSFLRVTGSKTDLWLVKTVGALVTVIGLAIAASALTAAAPLALGILAMGSSAALTIIDLVYVARRTIAPIYLLDAAIEVILIGAWAVVLML